MKKLKSYLLIIAIVTGLFVLKSVFFPVEKSKGAVSNKDGKKSSVFPVTVFVTGNSTLADKLYASGTVLANESADLKSEASGIVTYLNLPEGTTVKEGTLLLKVNDAELRAQLEKIKVDLKLAYDVERRQHQLFTVGGISRQEYDIVLARYNSLKADSAYYQAQVAKTEVHAPFSGVLGIRKISIGSYITSANTVTRIYQTDPVKIEFSLPEKYSSLFKAGDVVHFTTEGSNDIHEAKITVRDPEVDLESRSVHYLSICRNINNQLLPGAFARVELALKDKANTLFVPTESIVPVLNGKKVFVIKKGKAEEQMVKTGLRTEDYVQVISGLNPGDSVAVNGNFQLKPGASVKIIADKKKKAAL